MSLQRMPNGQYVNIADGTPPEVIARIRAQHMPSRTAAPRAAPVTEREARVRKLVTDGRRGRSSGVPWIDDTVGRVTRPLDTFADNAVHGVTFGLDDVIEGGVAAAGAALKGRSAGDAYSEQREARRRIRNQNNEENSIAGGVGTVAGWVGQPVEGVLKLGGKAIAAVAPRAAPTLARAAAMTRGPIAQGAVQGATGAGLTTLAETDGNIGQAAQSALLGGTLGAGAGAALRGATGVARAFSDRSPAQAERVAYDKIAAMLGRTRDDAGAAFTPAGAAAEVADATRRGTPTTLGDLSPEMANYRGSAVRDTSLPATGDVAARAEERLGSAAERFETAVKRGARTKNSGTDAVRARANISADRQNQAAIDYAKGGALDKPLAPTPHLINAITKPTPDMQVAMQAARRAFANDPDMGPFMVKVLQNGKPIEVPTTRAFDEIKKAFDDIIEDGIKYLPDGNTVVSNASRAASKQLRALKDQVGKSNPEYAELVGRQRDAFEKLDALEAGKNFIGQMAQHSRELLESLTAKGVKNLDEVRTGVIDALLAMRNTKRSPIKLLRAWERNPQQRAVLVHIMGGPKQFNEFSKFMRRELRAMQADEAVLRGSNRPVLNEFAEHGETPALKMGVWDTLRGGAYGGVTGAVSAGARAINRTATGMGPAARNETLRLLDSDGQGLAQGVAQARAVREARIQAARKRAQAAGRLAGGSTAAVYGTGE